jgi:hypothetical protein
MHISPNIKKVSKFMSNKRKEEKPQPTKLDFQNSNDLHDIWGTMQRDN